MLLSKGCSGSSYVFEVLKDLMELHGVHVWAPGRQWLRPPEKERLGAFEAKRLACTEAGGRKHYWPNDPVAKLLKAQAILNGRIKCREKILDGPTVFFVVGMPLPPLEYDRILDFLSRAKGSLAGMRRQNRLDSHICYSTDCSAGDYGAAETRGDPMLRAANGSKSDPCFGRREEGVSDDAHRVHLDARRLRKVLDEGDTFWRRGGPQWAPLRKKYRLETMANATLETLTAFDNAQGPMAVNESVDAFAVLLEGLGVPAEWGVVEKHMRQLQLDSGGKRARRSHALEVANAAEVRQALVGSKYEWMWRD